MSQEQDRPSLHIADQVDKGPIDDQLTRTTDAFAAHHHRAGRSSLCPGLVYGDKGFVIDVVDSSAKAVLPATNSGTCAASNEAGACRGLSDLSLLVEGACSTATKRIQLGCIAPAQLIQRVRLPLLQTRDQALIRRRC